MEISTCGLSGWCGSLWLEKLGSLINFYPIVLRKALYLLLKNQSCENWHTFTIKLGKEELERKIKIA
jgi:hypothetical protein